MSDLWPLGLMRRRAGGPVVEAATVRPQSQAEVVELVRRGGRVIPRGGGSGVMGAISPDAGDTIVDLAGLNRLLEVDEVNLLARVEAGINGLALETELNRRGLTLGHFPSSLPIASAGGLISTRSSGQQSTFHGNVEDLVAGLKVLLADGSIVEARAPLRSAVGPDLAQLFVGAEGALGIILEATLRISRLPGAVAGRGFDVADVAAGLELMREIVQRGLRPLVLRLYDEDDTQFQGARVSGCLLVAALAGEPDLAEAGVGVLTRLAARAGATDLGEEPFTRWRDKRFDLSAEVLQQYLEPPGSFVDTIEVAATWTALPALHRAVKRVLAAEGVALCHFSHAYPQGCCAYFTFAGSAADEPAAEAAYRRSWDGAMAAVLEAGGTIGHHHGTGRGRAAWVEREMGGWWTVWQLVRAALDPERRMNAAAVGGRQP